MCIRGVKLDSKQCLIAEESASSLTFRVDSKRPAKESFSASSTVALLRTDADVSFKFLKEFSASCSRAGSSGQFRNASSRADRHSDGSVESNDGHRFMHLLIN